MTPERPRSRPASPAVLASADRARCRARCTHRPRRGPAAVPRRGVYERSGRLGSRMADTEQRSAYSQMGEQWLLRGGGVDIITTEERDLSTQEMVLNIGPQHPSTHGVLRLVLELDGEKIRHAEPVIGYMHRAVEKLAEVDVPERARWIRTMMAEWNRILSHLMFTGSYPLELGAMTPMFYAFREREMIQDLMEAATGARMHHSYARVGGLKDGLPRGFLKQSAEVLKWIRRKLRDFDNLIMGNEIIAARTKGIGVLPTDVAVAYGASGPVLHASGVPMDPRKDEPYEKYDEVEFEVPVGTEGDCYDRLWVLVQRMHQSCNIVEQCMEKLPAGEYVTKKVPQKIPEGELYVRTENPLGLMGYYLVGDNKEFPYRLKMRTASFSNVSVLPWMLRGALVPDLIAILGSVFFVVGDIDR